MEKDPIAMTVDTVKLVTIKKTKDHNFPLNQIDRYIKVKSKGY